MTQDEKWLSKYNEVMTFIFIETNKRNPSKYKPEERLMVHFLKRVRECRGTERTKIVTI